MSHQHIDFLTNYYPIKLEYMINAIISFSIKNKLIILLFVVGLIAWGIFSMIQIPIGAVPDVTNNQVQVITTSRNLATEDIEQFITYPIELEMANLPGVQEIRSISKFGLSVVTIVFDDDLGTYLPRQLIAEKIKTAQEKIPLGFGVPTMGPISTGLGEIYQYILDVKPGYDSLYSSMDLRTIQDWIVKRQLIGIPGVVEVNTWGGYLKQYEVAVDPERLRAMNTTIGEVFRALETNNENAGGGYIEKYQESYFVRGEGVVNNIEDIENIVVKSNNGIPILMRDIGQVHLGYATRFGAITANGQGEKVMGQIMMLKGANSNKVIRTVKERIAEIQQTLPEGIYINPFLERSHLIQKTTHTVEENLLLGALIVIFVVVLLLGNLRSGIIVASIIPLSLLFAISMMNLFGISANLMSLGAIDFGIIIDGAVIIVEFIIHEIARNNKELLQLSGRNLQLEKDLITENAAKNMMHSAFFGQIIILIVFIPILTLSGVEGKMFRPMAMAFSFALVGAMILCLTYVPVISALLLKPVKEKKFDLSGRIMGWIESMYLPTIRYAIKHKLLTITGAILLLASSMFIYINMGGEFIPTLDEGDYVIQPVLRPGTSLTETIDYCTKVENILLNKFPDEVSEVASRIGAAEVPTDPMSMEMSDIIVRLKSPDEWKRASSKEELADQMKAELSVFPGVEYEFTQPIEMRFNELITGVRADLAIKIFGEDLQVLYDNANRIKKLIEHIPGASDITVEQIVGLPQMTVKYNREKLAHYGLNISDINKYIRMAFAGEVAGTVFEGEKRFDMVVRFGHENRRDIENLKQLYVSLPNGNQIPVEEIADIQIQRGPAQISRDDTRRRIVIGINVRNRDVESLVHEIEGIINQHIQLPEGYYITYGGQFENLQHALARLKVAVPVALLLIFILLYFTFNSISQALMVYTAIPLAAIGGVVLLWIRGMPFSISAGVGFIALFGIATLNGIVLITHFNELKERGIEDVKERVLMGAKARLRPVLLTAAAAALGFFPMGLSTSAGAEVQRPLATVVIGGLVTATLLTLVVLPVIYLIVNQTSFNARLLKLGAKSVIIFMFANLLISGNAKAQEQAREINLQQAIDQARGNNLYLSNARQEVQSAQSMVKTGWNLGETEFYYMQGQINSSLADNHLAIRQNFGSPFEQASRTGLLKKIVEKREYELAITNRDLEQEVSLAYYGLIWLKERRKLIRDIYALYEEADKIANLKYETGDSNYLSKVVMDTKKESLRVQLEESNTNLSNGQRHFKKLLKSDEWILPVEDSLIRFPLNAGLDSALSTPDQFLNMQYFKQNIQLNEQSLKTARSRISPSIVAGYFRQSIDEVPGFDGWELTLRIPIWFRPNIGEIQQARLQYEMAQNTFSQKSFEFQKDLEVLFNDKNTMENKLKSYEGYTLKNAEIIIQNASVMYKNGEIEYLDYIRNISEAINIKIDYLDNLNQYNQTVIKINYLLK